MKLLGIFTAVLITMLLAACNDPGPSVESQQATFNKKVEEDGCTIKYLGKYPMATTSDIPVMMVKCEAKTATTANYQVHEGKFLNAKSSVVIEGIEKQISELNKKKAALEKLSPEDRKLLGLENGQQDK